MNAGESSEARAIKVMEQANETLLDLQKFAEKFDFTKSNDKGKLRRSWQRTKFAFQVKDVDDIRKRIIRHHISINLLLTSSGRQVCHLDQLFAC